MNRVFFDRYVSQICLGRVGAREPLVSARLGYFLPGWTQAAYHDSLFQCVVT